MMIDTSVVGTATSLADGRVRSLGFLRERRLLVSEVFDPSSNSFSAAGSEYEYRAADVGAAGNTVPA